MDTAAKMRAEESRSELQRLHRHFQEWLTRRRAKDEERKQYHSQLGSLEAFMERSVSDLRRHLNQRIDLERDVGDVYEDLRLFDLRVLWLARVWGFFRDKFDQRDDPVLAGALAAADDVTWSCYRQAWEQPGVPGRAQQGPAPLPFIESWYSPEAFPADLVPHDLTTEVELGFLREHLKSLPIPLVRLPPLCIDAPWWLIVLAHEVGHHVQYDLLEEASLVGGFEERVALLAQRAGADGERWKAWSREIFADAFSIASVGPWAVWAIAELELRAAGAMTSDRASYPSAAVRLQLMQAMLTALELDATAALHGVLPPTADGDGADPAITAVAKTTVGVALPGTVVSLKQLCDLKPLEFGPGRAVERLADDLLNPHWHDEHEPAADGTRGARLAVCGAMAAWARLWACGGEAPAAHRETLAARTRCLIERSREEGTRERTPIPGPAADAGRDIVEALLAATPEQLGA